MTPGLTIRRRLPDAAVVIGIASTFSGLTASAYVPVPPGPASVLFALAVFVVAAGTRTLVRARRLRGGV